MLIAIACHLGSKTSNPEFCEWQKRLWTLAQKVKYIFGQKSRIAQTHLSKVTRGIQITNNDDQCLLEYYYTVSDSLVTLTQLGFESDLYSTDIIRQALRRPPSKFYSRWEEHVL